MEFSVSLRGRWFDRQLINDEQTNLNAYAGGNASTSASYTSAYQVMDLKIVKTLFSYFEVIAGINNIFDRQEYYAGQIKGRDFFAGISFTLK
jgi:outer membrane receptor for ferrienterochelin and colicin